jgi:cbb3-type cytochrome oxidase subunit 3
MFKFLEMLKQLSILKNLSKISTAYSLRNLIHHNEHAATIHNKMNYSKAFFNGVIFFIIIFFIGIIAYQLLGSARENFDPALGTPIQPLKLTPEMIAATAPPPQTIAPSLLGASLVPPTSQTTSTTPTFPIQPSQQQQQIPSSIPILSSGGTSGLTQQVALQEEEDTTNSEIMNISNRVSKIEAYNYAGLSNRVDVIDTQVQNILKQQQSFVADMNGGSSTPLAISGI